VETFLDGPDPAIATRGDDLLPLSHRFPCRACVISTDIATLSACDEVLGGRGEVGEAGVMHGLSQAQGVVRDLYAINRRGQRAYPCTRGAHNNYTYVFCSPQLSGKEHLGAAFALPGAFGLGRQWRGLLLWRKCGLDVPDGELYFVASVSERGPVWRQAPGAQTYGQNGRSRLLWLRVRVA
jgi:hypothetical protein